MIILIEGADGVGKTTLSNKLMLKIDASYIHATWSRLLDCRMLEYHMNILCLAYLKTIKTKKPVILDRLWLSESVYAEVYRNGSRYPYHGRMVLRFIDAVGGLTILCLADVELHKKQFNKCKELRWEMYDDVSPAVRMYNQFYNGYEDAEKYNDTYMRLVMLNGGAKKFPHLYLKYDMLDEGKDLNKFALKVKDYLDYPN